MKLIILLVAITWCNADKLDKTYLPPRSAQSAGGASSFLQTPFAGSDYQEPGFNSNGFAGGNDFSQNGNAFAQNGNGLTQNGNGFSQNVNAFSQNGNEDYNNVGFESRPERQQAAFERNAAILRQNNENDGETYSYAFETENGIYAEESGVATNGVEAQGGYSYTGDDGQVYSVRYTADQNGFVPQGDHLPTAPPVPEEILKALEQNARDEAAGIYDDGSYNEAKYNSEDQYNNASPVNNYNNQAYNNRNQFNGEDDDSVVTNSAVFRNTQETSAQQSNDYGSQVGQNTVVSNAASNQRGRFESNAVNQAYLPPFQRRSSNQGSRRSQNDDVTKAYLPPYATQAPNAFGARSQQSFSPRSGYQY